MREKEVKGEEWRGMVDNELESPHIYVRGERGGIAVRRKTAVELPMGAKGRVASAQQN